MSTNSNNHHPLNQQHQAQDGKQSIIGSSKTKATSILRNKHDASKKQKTKHSDITGHNTLPSSSSSNINTNKKRRHITFASNNDEMKTVCHNSENKAIDKKENDNNLDYDSDDAYNSFATSGEMIQMKTDKEIRMEHIKKKQQNNMNNEDMEDDDNNNNGDRFQGEEVSSSNKNNHNTNNTFSLQDDIDNEYPIEPFNFTEERTSGDGYFDGDTYIFRKKVHDDEEGEGVGGEGDDSWLDDTSLHSSSFKQQRIEATASSNEDKNDVSSKSLQELYTELIQYLEYNNETVTKALQRLGKHVKSNGINGDKDIVRICKRDIHQITDIANAIVMRPSSNDTISESSDVDIYQRSKFDLLKLLQIDHDKDSKNENEGGGGSYFSTTAIETNIKSNETTTTSQPSLKNNNVYQWYYKGNEDNKLHGPFTTKQMMDWKYYYGYFTGDNIVDVCYKNILKDDTNAVTTASACDATTDVADDLMKDLMDDDDEEEEEDVRKSENWIKSNEIDFKTYL